jgi:GTPase SAR1 family protein
MRIVFTGSHGVGKTSILKVLKEKLPDYDIQLESLTRKAVGDSSKLNLTTPEESEKLIAKVYMDYFLNNQNKNFVASRHMVDVFAYSIYLRKVNKNISDITLIDIDDKIQKIIHKKIFDVVCYIPIEFDLTEEETKKVFREGQNNKNYREDIDTIIKFYLWSYGIKYITITGSVEDRVKQVLEIVNKEEV